MERVERVDRERGTDVSKGCDRIAVAVVVEVVVVLVVEVVIASKASWTA